MIEYHDPRGERRTRNDAYDLGFDLPSANQARVAMLANGFPDSVRFLEILAEELAESAPGADFVHFNKGNATIPCPEELMERVSECHATVTAWGH